MGGDTGFMQAGIPAEKCKRLIMQNSSRRNFLKTAGFSAVAITGLVLPFCHLFMPQAGAKEQEKAMSAAKKILVVYFSVPETTSPYNMTRHEENSTVVIDGKVLGNTQYLALLIQKMTRADIFRLEPENPYPTEHGVLVDLAGEEQKQNARPAFQGEIAGFAEYDTVFIGYPNWWADMPMIVYTFLEHYDFTGKTIIPFCTHGGSGFSRTVQTMAEKAKGANVVKTGLAISRNRMDEARFRTADWLKNLSLFAE